MFLSKSRPDALAVTAVFYALAVTAFPAVPDVTGAMTPAAPRHIFCLYELKRIFTFGFDKLF
jgi:hypothetical protein